MGCESARSHNFEVTEGLDLIWQLQADPANVVLSSVEAELEGLAYYDAEYRWPAVRGGSGSITVTVPRAGTFYPAVVVYDTVGQETYALEIDGRRMGEFVADLDDRRQRIYFLRDPVEFRGGEKLTFRTGGEGSHITEDILLLAEKPPIRGRRFEMSHVEAGFVTREGEEQLRLTWITTWPAACTIEYGLSEDHVHRVTEEAPLANHRVYLSGLQRGGVYHYRIIAPRPDGASEVTPYRTFCFEPPPPAAGTARREQVPLAVENPYPFPLEGFPVTSGVPFARGELGDPARVRLLDRHGGEIAVQAVVTARWPDCSIKWLLVSFLANVEARTTAGYTLEYGADVTREHERTPLRHAWEGDLLTVETGPLRVVFDARQSGFPSAIQFDANGDGAFSDEEVVTGAPLLEAEIADTAGAIYTTRHAPERVVVEESGPVRTAVKVTGHHRSEQGAGFFAYVARFVFYAGAPFARLYYTWGNDRDDAEFTEFERVRLRIPLAAGEGRTWTLGLGEGREARGQGDVTLSQLRDDSFQVTPALPSDAPSRRADGWIDVSGPTWGVLAAVRDFWQLYPKALRWSATDLAIDLCPDFPPGTYDGCSRLDEIKWFYYLMRGCYKVRRGVQKQHEVLLCFHPGAAAGSPTREIARVFQEPLIAACPPRRYADTGVFGLILPAIGAAANDAPEFLAEYEQVCERVYENDVRRREEGREYGMLNFGDHWGERKVNWFNGEYDHHHAFLLQFARTGDRRWYFLGERAARHAIDVDTCHYGSNRGGYWIHSMGHTGDYFTEPYEGSGYPKGRFSDSHTWTEGFCDWYFLSGDPTSSETAGLIADYYDGAYLNNYDWTNCRTNGWHLILTMAAYRATDDPYYLNAARIIVERTLERQTPGGGWHRQMIPGHCYDMPRHRGEANFMLGVLANGLEEYYREVPDPRVAEAILGGAKQCVEELWVEEANGFRYTSCPNMKGYTANNDMTAEILFFADALGGDPRYGETAMRAMRAAFAGGIGSIAHLRWTPRILAHMDRIARRQAAGVGQPTDPARR